MSSNLHRNSTEANKHTPKGFDLAVNNSRLVRDERGQSRYIDNLLNERAENLVDGNSAPPTTTEGHVYVLIDEGSGSVHVDWQGANYNDIVRVQGSVWGVITPVSGYLILNKTDNKYYKFNGTIWEEFIPDSENIYTNNGTTGSNRTVTITDILNFNGGKVALNSTANGFLMNRVTTLQMNSIATPSTNELVFNTDLNGLYRYNGSSWVALSTGYGIIGVYSGSGNGTPTFFADLQSALETCKGSGQYYTVKLFSNITITSAIQIDYTGSGVGFAYQFRQLMIDFNGFSVTNAQANASEGFDVRLSNNVAVYQEIRFLNGNVLRTNGTGTHHALKCDQGSRYGIIKMSKMLWYCQNGRGASISILNSTAVDADKVCDLGGSSFISATTLALIVPSNSEMHLKNFNTLNNSSTDGCISVTNATLSQFTAENKGTNRGISLVGTANLSQFSVRSNSGQALWADNSSATVNNFYARSVSGVAISANGFSGKISNFEAETGNNNAIVFNGGGIISKGKATNSSASHTISCLSFNKINDIESVNLGSGTGLLLDPNGTSQNNEAFNLNVTSIGGEGSNIRAQGSAILNIVNCQFVSRWNNAGGHSMRVVSNAGTIKITQTQFNVQNASANCLFATVALTVNSRYCTHNDVASTPINANVTIVSSGIIS